MEALLAVQADMQANFKLERREPGKLRASEVFWRDRQPWLEQSGYMLRPRYRPDWIPSWKGTRKRWQDAEDEQVLENGHLIDATRISDGALVMIKLVTRKHPYEEEIWKYLSNGELARDPENHCVPLYEILHYPKDEDDRRYLVMPLLRRFDDPSFTTVQEVVEFLQQVFEGIHFMHKHNIAHRDCGGTNIMMDPIEMYPALFHPIQQDRALDFNGQAKGYTRSQRPPKYYIIDFGLSRKYNEASVRTVEDVIRGGDKSPPEHQGERPAPCDPFPTDVYYIGNLIRREFLEKYKNMDFMQDLATSMTQPNMSKRPTMDKAKSELAQIRQRLSRGTLSSRLANRKESAIYTFLRGHMDSRHD